LHDYQTLPMLRAGINRYFYFYNNERSHQSLKYKTPDEKYFECKNKEEEKVMVA